MNHLPQEHRARSPVPYSFENIRNLTRGQNIQNSRARNNIGYKGVEPVRDKFRAYISITDKDGKFNHMYLGTYKTAQEAARAYDIAAKRYFGMTAYTNGIGEDIVPTRTTRHDKRKKRSRNE